MKRYYNPIVYLLLLSTLIGTAFGMTGCSQTDFSGIPGSTQETPSDAVNTNTPLSGTNTAKAPDASQTPDNSQASTPADSNLSSQTQVFHGKIMETSDNSLLLVNSDTMDADWNLYHISIADTSILDKKGNSITSKELLPGMLIDIDFDGSVQEIYPANFHPSAIRVTGQSEDIAGLYLTMISDLYHTDEGLNAGISLLAFDLTKVTNLQTAEKAALLWMAGQKLSLETMAATFEELVSEGYINEESLSFETGLLYSIEDTPISKDTFTFNARKWRGGDGAYYFYDCKAVKKKGAWTYTVGEHMIS